MTSRKRPQPSAPVPPPPSGRLHAQTSGFVRPGVMMITPGLWATVATEELDFVIEGVNVHAVLEWDFERLDRYIDSLTIDKGTGVITPELLRTLTVPALAAKATSPIKFWVDEACTVPYDEQRWPGETLEVWAARIFWTSTIERKSPADEIGRIQGITVGSAHQRITMARKMGLLENWRIGEAARKAAKKKTKKEKR